MCRSGVGVYSAEAGAESESIISDSVHLYIGLDMDWTGSGLRRIVLILDWIGPVKCFTILKQDWIWTQLIDKNCAIFVITKLYFAKFLEFIWTWILNFLKILDYGWTWTEFLK